MEAACASDRFAERTEFEGERRRRQCGLDVVAAELTQRTAVFACCVVLGKLRGDDIAGLVILSVEPKRLVFSNLVGSIDLTRLARLRGTLSVPGLDRLPAKMEPEQPKAEERP